MQLANCLKFAKKIITITEYLIINNIFMNLETKLAIFLIRCKKPIVIEVFIIPQIDKISQVYVS